MTRLRTTSWLFAMLLVSACASTSWVSVRKSASAKPLQLKGEKVAAVVLMKAQTPRKAAEDQLAREITRRGAVGVPLYTIVPDATEGDEDKVRTALEAANFKGVVVMHPIGSTQQVTVTQDPGFDRFYGGYYGYAWTRDSQWEAHTDTIVTVDTRVYSLAQNQLVWEGRSKTTNPDNVSEFVTELAAATADELANAGLIGQ